MSALAAFAVLGATADAEVSTQADVAVYGASAFDSAGSSVSGAGDVNGDGRADVLVGAPGADNNGRNASGSVYVVFGKAESNDVDLAALARRGFRIDGPDSPAIQVGVSVAGVGDVNGDGFGDVATGSWAGPAYVVFGSAAKTRVDLGALGNRGFRIEGSSSSPVVVAGAGDVNADGLTDVLVGAPFTRPERNTWWGSAYVVFGQRSTTSVNLSTLGEHGFRIDGEALGDQMGRSVGGGGDVNGDGYADVIVGARYARNNGREDSGSAYVVFGSASTATIDLAALGERGFRIDGASPRGLAASSVAGAGDVNGDGRPDVLVGEPDGDTRQSSAGHAYVVFGSTSTTNVDLATLGQRGFRIDGRNSFDTVGESVSGVGDVNGDGHADVIVGAPSFGAAYVVFGSASTATLNLAALGERGFQIDGAQAHDIAGDSVGGAGDFNGDGMADVLVGAWGASNNGRDGSGSAYIVMGKRSSETVDLAVRVDTVPPDLVVAGRSSQRALHQRGILVSASCDEACTVEASGALTIRGQRRKLALQPSSSASVAAAPKRLRLGFDANTRRRLAAALEQRLSVRATVAVRAVDRAGNASRVQRTITVKR